MQTRTARPSVACGPPVTDPVPSCWICGADAAPDTRYAGLPLVRCGACGFVFAPVRSAEELHALYTTDYFDAYPGGQAYDADEVQRRHEATVRMRWLRSYATGGRLLEIGSASGWFLAQARDAGFEVEGIEPAADVAFAATAAVERPRAGRDGGDRLAAGGRAGRRRRVARARAHRHARRRPGAPARGAAPGRAAHDRGAERRERGVAVAGRRLVPPRPRAPRRALRAVDARRPPAAHRVHADAGRHVPDRRLPAPRPRAQPARDRVAGQAGGAAPRVAARPAPDAARDAARGSRRA